MGWILMAVSRMTVYGAVSGVFLIDLFLPRGIAPGMLYTAPVLMTRWLGSRHYTLLISSISAFCIVMGFALSPIGTETWVSMWNRTLALGTVGIMAFLTVRRQEIEEELKAERDLFRVTLTSLGEGVLATDAAGTVTFMNPVAERLSGWAQTEAHGLRISEVLPLVSEHSRAPVDNPALMAMRKGKVVVLDNHTLLLNRAGHEVPVADSGAPICDVRGRTLGAVMVLRDISAEKAAMETLRRAKDEAETANRTKDEFLASMSHELRTPLHIIVGYVDLLAEGEFGQLVEAQHDALRRIRQRTLGLTEMVSSILDLNRLTSGQLPVDIREVQISQLLAEAWEDMDDLCRKKNLAVNWRIAEDLPSLFTDGKKLKVVCRNLIHNAIKYTPAGTITLEARRQNDGIDIVVADTGLGIAPDELESIFELFRQFRIADADPIGGVGLGLYLVKHVVALLGGTVSVESAVGRGSTFRVWLPRRRVEVAIPSSSEKLL